MPAKSHPTFGELDEEQCVAILTRNFVGRIAFTFKDQVDIEPIHYAYADGWIVGRTAPGTKLTTLRHAPWVAFEVDEVQGVFDWRSVVVHGTVYFLALDDPDRTAFTAAVEQLRSVIPNALAEGDPTPFRDVLFRIHVDTIAGRWATPK